MFLFQKSCMLLIYQPPFITLAYHGVSMNLTKQGIKMDMGIMTYNNCMIYQNL